MDIKQYIFRIKKSIFTIIMAKKVLRRKFLAGGLATALAISAGGIYYFAKERPGISEEESQRSSQIALQERDSQRKTQVLYEDSIKPRGIAVHGVDDLSYLVLVRQDTPIGNLEDSVREKLKGSTFEKIEKWAVELRRLKGKKEGTVMNNFPVGPILYSDGVVSPELFSGGENHIAIANSDLPSKRCERVLAGKQGNLTYALRETDISNKKTGIVYCNSKKIDRLLTFNPIAGNKDFWIARYEGGESIDYILVPRQNLGRKAIEVSVSTTANHSEKGYWDSLRKQFEQKAGKKTADIALGLIKGSQERAGGGWEIKKELGIPQNYNVVGYSGNSVYVSGYEHNKKKWVILKKDLPEKYRSKGGKK